MAFNIPTLTELAQRSRNAFNAELKGTDAFIWPSNVYVSAKVFAGLVWQIFGRLKWIDKQRFAYTATGGELDKHARELGMSRKAATFAKGNIFVVADNIVSIPAGTRFTRADGLTFDSTLVVPKPIGGNVFIVPVACNTAGKTGNTIARTPMTAALAPTYLGNVTTMTVDDDGIGLGAEVEDDESLRERILARKRQPPMGGSENDYWQWARSIPGVTRVFVEGNARGPGSVTVWFLMDGTYANGIPQAADITAMQNYLDVMKPVTATVFVEVPTPDCLDIVVKGLSPDTDATRQAAALEIQQVFLKQAKVGTSKEPSAIHLSWLWQAVSNATGEQYHTIEAPSTDLTFGTGRLPCLSSVKFT